MNSGKYSKPIHIYKVTQGVDSEGFSSDTETLILTAYAEVKTTKGMTLIKNNTDFEKALTRFTIRYTNKITRDMIVKFRGKVYTIEYINNVDEDDKEIELQCKEVMH